MWHFGRQNIGVFAFSSYISTRKPMTKLERNLIQLGIFAGVFGSYSVFAPTLMLNRDLFPFDLTHFDYTFSLIYKLGSFLYIVLIPVVFWYLLINSHKFNYRHCLLLLISIFFFLPLYLSDNPSYSLASYTTAHGLQYLLFLLFHSLANTNSKLVFLNSSTNSYSSKVFLFPFVVMPIVLLITCVFLAIELWGFLASVQVNGITDVVTIITKELSMKIAYGLILGITMAHYWVDQKLWKFSTKERRDWLSLNYPFLFNR